MAFTNISAQHIASSDGFEVLPGGRFAKIYKENSHQMEIALEFGRDDTGNVCVTLWPGAFARWTDQSAVLSNEEQLRIENNFREAMAFAGLTTVIWDPRTEKYVDSAVYHGRLTATWE